VITFETSVRVGRPIEDVFAFVADPFQFPRWNSAVQAVDITSGRPGEPGSTYSMVRDLPTGRVENELQVVARDHPTEFGIRTTSGPTAFVYRYRFTSEDRATVVRLDASSELPGVPGLLGPVAAFAVRRRVDANFAALRRTLEREVGTAAPASA
jgi:uncharacterized protein YndB with AHSA1/START domain